ncbi:MAG: SUMF1/EgtB/PvdO family nonheme iron enzyme [Planctomycetaceae bacterium]|jgi:formylglycine-generating enzyme required for sulfatase activity|nr:SUMF1/EgtB/PvdO family nonheme iron enzyme [Planctomycetaceae bacterium]
MKNYYFKKIGILVLVLVVSFNFCVLQAASPSEAAFFEIESWAYDRGNFAVSLNQYRAGGPPMILYGGIKPAYVEYDIPFPVAGKYQFSIFAAVHEKRPLTVFLDGKEIGKICNEKTTPSWNTIDAQWFAPLELEITEKGFHTLKLFVDPYPPHLVRLRFDLGKPLPKDFKIQRPKAQKLTEDQKQQYQGETNLTATLPKPDAIRHAIVDLIETYGEKYPKGKDYLTQLDAILAQSPVDQNALEKLRYEAVFQNNPVINFDQILLVRRNNKGSRLGFPANYESNSSLPKKGYDDEIMTFNIKSKELSPVHKPPRDTLISDLDLHFDAERLMFSAVGENNRWHVFELQLKTGEAKQLTHGDNDVDFYDSCYLPDGRIITTCTAAMVGVPCVTGSSHVANLFLLDPKTQKIRQLCFDQEHNWSPAVLNDGRVLYTRWEYADIPHANSRLLFHCNPDGTSQLEYYGSNSYWPASILFTRPIPNHPSRVVGIVGGHHDSGRIGEMVILDPAISRSEADGAVQKITGYGKKVRAAATDGLTRKAWPKFTHPAPLSEKYFLVAAKPKPDSLFGIYFVDVFDNMILLKELSGNALVEPLPLTSRSRPPVITDRIDPNRDDAHIFISDIYEGPGLTGIPRGTVKSLRVYTYHYAFHNTGGLLGSVGQDGPWDVRGILGTVPVEKDGSAYFRIPANFSVSVLPLDENGQALQLMRSWMTAMPGENLQCTGCHDSQNNSPPAQSMLPAALRKKAAEITPYNPPNPDGKTLLEQLNVKGFSFAEQIQPVLDRYCVECHNGEAEKEVKTALVKNRSVGTALNGKPFAINLRGDQMIEGWSSAIAGNCGTKWGGKWSVAYDNLQRFVRRPGIESDYGLFSPMEYSANTTELVQILRQGHYGVQLDKDSWNRLTTWIDMNAPYHGNWTRANSGSRVASIAKRRLELASLYGAAAVDFESHAAEVQTIPVKAVVSKNVHSPDWIVKEKDAREKNKRLDFSPMTAEEAVKLQKADGTETEKTIQLDDGFVIKLTKIPAYGLLKKSFWIGTLEITNAQFRKFDPQHSSRYESRTGYQFGRRGYDVNGDELPVVRASWNKANEFCQWLSKKTSLKVNLPTEEQWEYACRAGTTLPFWFGDMETDFSRFANFGDYRLKEFVADTYHKASTEVLIIRNPNPFDDRFPKDERFNDGCFLQTAPGEFLPNPFGLFDMHGNVAEWTRSEIQVASSLRKVANNSTPENVEKIVKGGSWFDRPYRCTSDFRISYPPYQPVFNVGFRIVVED